MNDAERLFNDVFLRGAESWRIIQSFGLVVEVRFPTGAIFVARATRQFMQEQVSLPPGESIFIGEIPPSLVEEIQRDMAEATMARVTASVDAASFVFMQSALDSAAFDYCRIAVMLAPDDWFDLVKSRQVALREVRDASFPPLLQAMLARYLEQLERESLLKKIDLLPRRDVEPPASGYKFDRDRVERLDRLRQDIIHGDALGKPIANAAEELDYLQRTSVHLLTLIADHFNLKLSPMYMKEWMERRKTK